MSRRKKAATFDADDWEGSDSALATHIVESNEAILAAYRARPLLVFEHANIERSTAQGGYGRRQLYELIQNGADALAHSKGGRIHVVLTEDALYCANEGEAVDNHGIDAILSSHISMKRGLEIGRFGLGFKSVLGVTDRPEFYSRSASFGFDAPWCRKKILASVPDLKTHAQDDRTPALRLAEPRDPESEAENDETLKELMAWATTVVKLPLNQTESAWLPEDLEKFPAEFMLFSPHVSELRLEDRTSLLDRSITLRSDGGVHVLSANGDPTRWAIFEIPEYKPSQGALSDAGELAHRESVPIIWAVPLSGQGRQARGRFWAFFPTEYETTLAGILNAPWKTNEDRQNLLPGAFNEELIDVASQLVVDNLAKLIDPDDPGYYLELLPGRGREAPHWADERLTNRVYELARQVPSLPDQDGKLRLPADMRIFPDSANQQAIETWEEYPKRPRNWCHSSVFARDRHARVLRLLGTSRTSGPETPVEDWLEALVGDRSVHASAQAVRVASRLLETDPTLAEGIRRSAIVVTEAGNWVVPDPDMVFLPITEFAGVAELDFVHSVLVEDRQTAAALTALGIRPADSLGELRSLLAVGLGPRTAWDSFWQLCGRLEIQDCAPLLSRAREHGEPVWVRTVDGKYRPLPATLLPGAVVPEDGSRDSAVAISLGHHGEHLELLQRIGASTGPEPAGGGEWEDWFVDYRRDALVQYYSELPKGSGRPKEELMVFDRGAFVGPLGPLAGLSMEGRSHMTEAALNALDENELTWNLRHRTQGKYPVRAFPSPALWRLRRDGILDTSLGVRPVSDCVSPNLGEWGEVLPVPRCSRRAARMLELPDSLEGLSDRHWQAALALVLDDGIEDRTLGRFYAAAAEHRDPPDQIRCRLGTGFDIAAPEHVTVVYEKRQLSVLQTQNVPALLAPSREAAGQLISAWKLRPTEEKVRTEIVHVPSALGVPLGDRFPDLVLSLSEDQLLLEVQPCEVLQIDTLTAAGRTSEDKDFRIESGLVMHRAGMPERDLLERVSQALSLELTSDEVDAIVENRETERRRDDLKSIAKEKSDAKRLMRLLSLDAIRRRLSEALIEAFEEQQGELDHESAARLLLASHGVETLRELREELDENGWSPPSKWAGSRAAKEYVRLLGFDEAYAGFEERRLDPVLSVDGPAQLPPLHDFQSLISQETRELLRKVRGTRGLLSLPTGAGKTRITVQAIIEAIRDGELGGPILWVAETRELCEQAVQTWAFVWRALGPQERLHIGRLWESNEVAQIETGVQVIVATIAKLQICFPKDRYDWLRSPGAVVIDEAHGSTTPIYTEMLSWIGMSRGKAGAPLIGLTATPYRGTSEAETTRLVNRYGKRRLDKGVFGDTEPYRALQEMGVLAKVEHELLEGTEIELTESELEQLDRTKRLPSGVGQRIGANASRNQILLNSIGSLPDDWPVLVFASSVDHAQTMSALLNLNGIRAASISAKTDAGARRHYVEEFRHGKIRVLTNYGVLAQGFDAPATRAVYVARPTFSPTRYQQMIGRGLRGPLNGGEDVCLIVNVADNILQFGDRLAFWDFEHLWDET